MAEEDHEKMHRGPTISKTLLKAKKKGIKFDVEWNEHEQPIGDNRALLISHIGVVVRMTVPITYSDWKQVPNAIKENLWDELLTYFIIDESHQKWVLKKAGQIARNFRTFLANNYLKDKDGNIIHHPPAAYSSYISHDQWDEFVYNRLSLEFQELSNTNRERACQQVYMYRKGRKAYADLEQEIAKESGEEVSQISRHRVWKAGHQNSEGKITDPEVQKVCNAIDILSESASQGEINISGRQDILARALMAQERPGRVRGVGFGPGVGDYFQSEPKCKHGDGDKQKQEWMERMIGILIKKVSKFESVNDIDSEFEPVPHMCSPPGPSVKDSYNPTPHEIPRGIIPCNLYASSGKLVGKGKVFNDVAPGEEIYIHTIPLSANHVKVGVDCVLENCPLPVPIEKEELFMMEQALGTCIAWPINLVKIIEAPNEPQEADNKGKGKVSRNTKESVAGPLKGHRTPLGSQRDDLRDDPCFTIRRYARMRLKDNAQLSIDMDERIFNVAFTEMLGEQQIMEILHHKQIGASIINTYIRFLYYTYMVPSEKTERFSFISPHMIPFGDEKYSEEKSKRMAKILYAHRDIKKLIMAPYNMGDHWVLIVFNTSVTESLYYLDSLYRDPQRHSDMRSMFNRALEFYRSKIGAPPTKNTKWIRIKAPRQTGATLCGYYVMRFMRDIILHDASSIPLEYFPDYLGGSYDYGHIEEVVEEWAAYMVTHCIEW